MKRYQLIGKEGKELPIIISSDSVIDFMDLMNWSVSHFKKHTKELSDAPSLPTKENRQSQRLQNDSVSTDSKALPVSKKHRNNSRTDNARNRAIRAAEFSKEHGVSFNQAFRKLFNINSTTIYEVYAEEAGHTIDRGIGGRPLTVTKPGELKVNEETAVIKSINPKKCRACSFKSSYPKIVRNHEKSCLKLKAREREEGKVKVQQLLYESCEAG